MFELPATSMRFAIFALQKYIYRFILQHPFIIVKRWKDQIKITTLPESEKR
jgi:hypothetical protein